MLTDDECYAIFTLLENFSDGLSPDHYMHRLYELGGRETYDWQRWLIPYLERRIYLGV